MIARNKKILGFPNEEEDLVLSFRGDEQTFLGYKMKLVFSQYDSFISEQVSSRSSEFSCFKTENYKFRN